MKHEVDLSKYNIRTDLAIDLIKDEKEEGILCESYSENEIKVTSVILDSVGAKKLNKKVGEYITIEFEDVTDSNNRENVQNIFIKQLKELLFKLEISNSAFGLIIGLGNDKSTPDSLGPLSIENILVTNHLYELGELSSQFRRVSAIIPRVTGTTGIETSDIISGVVSKIKPEFLIVIDALASGSIDRINKTIQLTDTGIIPGSGVGNSRKEISKNTFNIPVIAVGVPTTVDAVTIVSDTINYLFKHFSFTKSNMNNPSNKLMIGIPNYLKKNIEVKKEDKENLMGIIGNLSESEIKQLIMEVLTPIGYNLMVTPKEIDFVVGKLAEVIGNGINFALHDIKVLTNK